MKQLRVHNGVPTAQLGEPKLTDHLSPPDRKHADDAVDRHADDALAFRTAPDELHADVDRRLLAEPHDLGAGAPVPADERLVSPGGDEVLGRERYGADPVEVAGELLEGREGEGGKEVHASVLGPFERCA
jgi:hypothetical protein